MYPGDVRLYLDIVGKERFIPLYTHILVRPYFWKFYGYHVTFNATVHVISQYSHNVTTVQDCVLNGLCILSILHP